MTVAVIPKPVSTESELESLVKSSLDKVRDVRIQSNGQTGKTTYDSVATKLVREYNESVATIVDSNEVRLDNIAEVITAYSSGAWNIADRTSAAEGKLKSMDLNKSELEAAKQINYSRMKQWAKRIGISEEMLQVYMVDPFSFRANAETEKSNGYRTEVFRNFLKINNQLTKRIEGLHSCEKKKVPNETVENQIATPLEEKSIALSDQLPGWRTIANEYRSNGFTVYLNKTRGVTNRGTTTRMPPFGFVNIKPASVEEQTARINEMRKFTVSARNAPVQFYSGGEVVPFEEAFPRKRKSTTRVLAVAASITALLFTPANIFGARSADYTINTNQDNPTHVIQTDTTYTTPQPIEGIEVIPR